MCDVLQGVLKCVTKCDRLERGSKLVKNSVTYVMGGPYSLSTNSVKYFVLTFSLFFIYYPQLLPSPFVLGLGPCRSFCSSNSYVTDLVIVWPRRYEMAPSCASPST